jgi:Uma2 family endonuclease
MNTAMTWEQICDDPHLRDLPYKIEQDRYGRIVMSPPPRADHGRYQILIGALLGSHLAGWAVYGECGIDTSEGVKVPDVAAMPGERARRHRGATSLPEAPEICVEVLSWSNTSEEMDEKRRLYAGKGCLEFWTCSEDGRMTFFNAGTGQTLPQSALCPAFPPLIRLD